MHPSLLHREHRPWPLPRQRWRWQQAWSDLAFIHYPISPERLRPFIPRGLKIQQYEGSAWLGIVPFRMSGIAPRGFPKQLCLPEFPELNLRTYVEAADGKAGVWFFSLDTTNWPLIFGGKYLYGLPYYRADMELKREGDWFACSSRRRATPAIFRGRYRPKGETFYAQSGSFAHWLTERYCLYAVSRDALFRTEVHHAPWPLFEGEAEIEECSIAEAAHLEIRQQDAVIHFSPGVQVVSFGRQCL
jgi:hypothetical protein